MSLTNVSSFNFAPKDNDSKSEAIKWESNGHKYEIYAPILRSMDLYDLLSHSLLVRARVLSTVGANDPDNGPSLYEVFGRSLSIILLSVWEQINASADADNNVDNTQTRAHFDARLTEFIAAHSTADDRYELIQHLRSARKPRHTPVQTFWYLMREYNSYALWLPGNEPALTENQMKQAIHDAMPEAWRERFGNAGNSVGSMTTPEIVQYFRKQENLAARKMAENNLAQKRQASSNRSKRNGSPKQSNKQPNHNGNNGKSNGKRPASNSTRIPDDTPCPVHPGCKTPHTWGQCSFNASNPNRNRDFKRPRKDKDTGSDGHAAAVETEPASSGRINAAINDDPMDVGTFECTLYCYVNEDLEVQSHHLDGISFSATQENKGDCAFTAAFTSLCDDAYSSGDNDITLKTFTDITQRLCLRSISVMTAGLIQGVKNDQPLRVLFDTGSDKTMANYRILPKGAHAKTVQGKRINGVHGIQLHNQEILLSDIGLPEFTPTQRIPGPIRAIMMKNDHSPYDIIVGMDTMQALGIDISCATKTVTWNGNTIPFRPANYFSDSTFGLSFLSEYEEEDPSILEAARQAGYKSKTILHSKYEKVDPQEVANKQVHLTEEQRNDLSNLFAKFDKLFSGKLGCYPHRKVHLELKEGTTPFSCRPYPVPKHHEQVFKDELDRLVQAGVLSKCGASEWLSPNFLIPKKDGRVRWISDFRALNKCIKRKVYNLPKIQDVLTRRKGYAFLSKIDISMHYYTFELDEASKNLCTICTPYGNYRYNRLPMGVSQSPDIAQEVMEDLFRSLEETDVYIDDVGVFNDDWQSHLRSLDKVLTILQDNNFTVNPFKCEWGVKETDWLGYWLTPVGLKPWKKKVDALLRLQRPQTPKQLRSFLGAINFYRDMYPRRSHILAPLTKLSGLKNTSKLPWNAECQAAFDQIKALLAEAAFLRFPDHNKPFHIYVDASDLQLGAAIFQDGQPVAYYTRKLNAAQRNYTTGEKELLSIVETLKEFKTMLYGCPNIHVYTDHKNNTFQRLQTQRILRWRLFLEDYGVHIHYIKGTDNLMADTLSRLPLDERQHPVAGPSLPVIDAHFNSVHADDGVLSPTLPADSYYSMAIDDDDLLDCFVNLPASSGVPFVLDYKSIADAQLGDARLQDLRQKQPDSFVDQLLAPNTNVVCYIPQPNAPWKIYLPTQLLRSAINWYHLALGHIGQNRLHDSMAQHLYHPDLRSTIEDVVTRCVTCQEEKNVLRGHGQLAPREANAHPWREVAVDLVGPWKITINNVETEFRALTIIDTVTNLVELVRIDNKTSEHVAMHFENTWLSRYPMPRSITYDQGGEFIGRPFQQMLARHGIQARPTTAKNPQANSLCERMHQTVANSLRAMRQMTPPAGIQHATQLVDTALANCLFATRSTVHSALRASPGSLAFNRDMILDIPMVADWELIRQNRQQLIDARLIAANRKRFSHDYHVGDEVYKLKHSPNKLESRVEGPYRINTVHTNGTVTIQLTPHVIERISIRRIKPSKR